jgi:hypothetical protein
MDVDSIFTTDHGANRYRDDLPCQPVKLSWLDHDGLDPVPVGLEKARLGRHELVHVWHEVDAERFHDFRIDLLHSTGRFILRYHLHCRHVALLLPKGEPSALDLRHRVLKSQAYLDNNPTLALLPNTD